MADHVRRVMAWRPPALPGWELVLSASWLDGLPDDHYYLPVRKRQPRRVRLPGGRVGKRQR